MNAAGSSPMAAETHAALIGHLELEQQMGGYAAANVISPDTAHEALAALLGSSADEIALAESAQVAWAKAFYSLRFREGDRILCFESDYAGNAVAFLQATRRAPVSLEIVPMRADGIIDIPALQHALEKPIGGRTLVALQHCGSAESVVQPARDVGQLCRRHGALFLLDACQTVGQLPVDVDELQCDFLCGTGRKWLRGPRGTGFLYARRSVLESAGRDDEPGGPSLVGEPPMIDHTSVRWHGSHSARTHTALRSLHSALTASAALQVQWRSRGEYDLEPSAKRYEMWEASAADRVGLGVAAEQCRAIGPSRIQQISRHLAKRLREGLAAVDGVAIRDAPESFDESIAAACGASRAAIVAMDSTGAGVSTQVMHAALVEHKIAATLSSSFHTFDDGLWARQKPVRFSPSYYNTEEEVDRVIAVVRGVVEEHRRV